MKTCEIVLLLVLVLLGFSIDPNDYIWFNYDSSTIVKPFNVQYYEVPLPCQTRIKFCQYQFTLLPPSWTSQNNKLLIPSTLAYKNGTYSVQVTVKDFTGESLDFSLILDLVKGKVTTSDRGAFFKQNDYTISYLTVTANKSIISPAVLSNFPTFPKIQETLNTGSIFSITSLVTDVVQRSGSCTQKLSYLLGVRSLFQNKIAEVEGSVKVIATEIDARFKQIQILQGQKTSIKNEMNSNTKVIQLKKQINAINATRTTYYQNYNRYTIIANSFLQKIEQATAEQLNDKADTNVTLQISEMQKEVRNIDNEIKQLVSQKTNLEKEIAFMRIFTVTNEASINIVLQSSLKDQYQLYSDLAIQQKIKYQNLDYEINALTQTLNNSGTNKQALIDEEIASIKAEIDRLKTAGSTSKIDELSSLITVLQGNAKTVEDKKASLKASCSSN